MPEVKPSKNEKMVLDCAGGIAHLEGCNFLAISETFEMTMTIILRDSTNFRSIEGQIRVQISKESR